MVLTALNVAHFQSWVGGLRGEAMLPHPHPHLLPKVVVKTVLVSPTPFPPRDGAHVRQACSCAPQLTKVLQSRIAETKASKSQAWNKTPSEHCTHRPHAILAAAAPAAIASTLLEC
uniref:Uncharacterized protein n=1 Tax=Mus musculus TaxID=10090 RepID=Q3TMS8_MOUSE|nr:unnamed protein product [Mus musculus]